VADTITKKTVAEHAKELLADARHRIVLDDFVNEHLRAALEALSPKHFPVSAGGTNEDLVKRISAYESAVRDLLDIVILVARWGDAEGQNELEKIFLRLAEAAAPGGGTVLWLHLRWYPLAVLMYATGIAALAARRFNVLSVVLSACVQGESRSEALVSAVMNPLNELNGNFKALLGHERDRFPRSDHLCATLREPLDRLLFLGASYEPLFDRFEVLLPLAYADLRDPKGEGDVWGPPGRFTYKQGRSNSPMDSLIEDATAAGSTWPLLSSGLFGGQSARFLRVAEAYRELIKRQGRW
jgi:hypothetical protein